ncbi:MBL fold metallo-hydrolase [Streptomyces sp. NPDC052114]|uniref:MBL fold metallo-hydrolase n=1 Tax=unclassified Streptomyces TaxID=2593676 RepID=UPI003448B001
MDVIEVLPELHMLRFPVGQAYLWRDGDELTLIDAGAVGAGAEIARAVTGLGLRPRDVRRIVLTHFHEDHAGGAGEFAALSGAPVYVHASDAPFVRGEAVGPEPVYEDWEIPIHAAAKELLPPAPEDPVLPGEIREVADGDVLDFGGGARVVGAPGHTAGSVAVHLPAHGVLFTGDAVAASPVDGQVILGVLNVDRERAIASFRRLAALEHEVACFGHGGPVTERASEVLRAAADGYPSSPSVGAPASR